MNPYDIYRIYVEKETNDVVILGVNNTEFRQHFDNFTDAYTYACEFQQICKQSNILTEVYNGIDEAKDNR